MRIGIDLMGGDTPPGFLFPAVLQAVQRLGDRFSFFVLATPTTMKACVDQLSELPSNLLFFAADEVIGMDDEPLTAIRRKNHSSLVKGVTLLKNKEIDAFVSCGNTGALIAAATLMLPHIKGVARPALLAEMPTATGTVAILDVGGNVACKADHLVSYAFLGAAYVRAAHGITRPRVALLNIGTEAGKGTGEVKEAYRMLEHEQAFDFCGNIEGREIFRGRCDVIVTDGFSGNIMLKTAEGVSEYLFECLRQEPSIKADVLDKLGQKFDYTRHPGALVCGVDGLVFKVHGNADAGALLATILGAADCLSGALMSKIKEFAGSRII